MLTIKNLMFTLILVLGFSFALDAQIPPQSNPQTPATPPGQEMQQNQTPEKVIDFIGKHFPRANVQNERKGNNDTYEVDLTGGTQLKFDNNNDIISIRSTTELPENVIPASIRMYVNSQHEGKEIRSWEKSGHEQKLKLDDDTELTFDSDGNFIR